MHLVWPSKEHLASYIAALMQGWSPDNMRPEAAQEELDEIARDSVRFIAEQDDREGKGQPVKLPDGRTVPRLPGYHRWMWDGEFCGSIGFRWQPGTEVLPPHCLGHIGYAVVPWKRRHGYATHALGLLLSELDSLGLRFVELTSDATNIASQRVIEANGGMIVEEFNKPESYGGEASLRFRIYLNTPSIMFKPSDLNAPESATLIAALNAELLGEYADPGAAHFALNAEEVTGARGKFLKIVKAGVPVGCGAVRLLDAETAELKRMYVAPSERGAGLGRRLVMALEAEARALGVKRLVLETGVRQAAALALYRRMGFRPIPLFGEYCLSPETSVCLEKELQAAKP